MASIFGKIGKLFSFRAPTPQRLPPPYTAEQRRREAFKKMKDRTEAAERKTREMLADQQQSDPVWRFVNLGEKREFPQSSNVSNAWYERAQSRLFITFHDASVYQYENVSPAEAEALARSTSAGTFIWDNLRIRGTALGHRKEYSLLVSPPQGRQWEMTQQHALEHSKKVAEQSGARSVHEKLGKFALKKPLTNKGRRPRGGKF